MTLPLVLAGPIVRRIDARLCTFWVALSSPAKVTADVWSGIQQSKAIGSVASGAPKVATGSAPTVRFGAKFHVAVVTARAPASLQPGSILSYDLSFDPTEGGFTRTHLKAEKLLDDELATSRLAGVDPEAPLHLALGYRPGQLPSFVTPAAAIVDLKIAQASCRNPAANGADGMGFLDGEVAANLENALARPQQLFLTGDQIYADDVPRSMMKPVADLAAEIIGGAGEQVPVGTAQVAVNLVNFPIQRRLRLVREEARMTTTDGHNHMFSFGEFAALHLMAWSTRVWRALAKPGDVYKPTTGSAVADKLTDWEACHKDDLGQPSLKTWEKRRPRSRMASSTRRSSGTSDAWRSTASRSPRPPVCSPTAPPT